MERRRLFLENAFNEAVPFFDAMRPSQLKHFYRTALRLNKVEIAKDIRSKMATQKQQNSVSVVARFEFEGMQICVANNEIFFNHLVDVLIESINYKISIEEYSEFDNFFGAHNFIKYHAEKKALAFLLK